MFFLLFIFWGGVVGGGGGGRNLQHCSKITNSLSFYLLRYLSKCLYIQKCHPHVASWILLSSKVFIFKINTHNAGRIEPEKKSTAIIIRVKS